MGDWLDLPGWVGTVFGVVMLAWALMVTLYANRRYAKRSEVDRVLKGNLIWIALAIIVIAIPGSMSSDGKWLVAIGAAIFAGFATAQFFARTSLDPTERSEPSDTEPLEAGSDS